MYHATFCHQDVPSLMWNHWIVSSSIDLARQFSNHCWLDLFSNRCRHQHSHLNSYVHGCWDIFLAELVICHLAVAVHKFEHNSMESDEVDQILANWCCTECISICYNHRFHRTPDPGSMCHCLHLMRHLLALQVSSFCDLSSSNQEIEQWKVVS